MINTIVLITTLVSYYLTFNKFVKYAQSDKVDDIEDKSIEYYLLMIALILYFPMACIYYFYQWNFKDCKQYGNNQK